MILLQQSRAADTKEHERRNQNRKVARKPKKNIYSNDNNITAENRNEEKIRRRRRRHASRHTELRQVYFVLPAHYSDDAGRLKLSALAPEHHDDDLFFGSPSSLRTTITPQPRSTSTCGIFTSGLRELPLLDGERRRDAALSIYCSGVCQNLLIKIQREKEPERSSVT